MHAKISHENGKHSFSQSAKSARYAWNGAKEISSRTQCHSLGTTGNFLRCSSCQHWHLYCTAVFRDHWNIPESQRVNNMTAIKIYSLHFPLFQEIRGDFFLIIAATALCEVTSSIERFFRACFPLQQCKSLIKTFQWKLHGVAFTALTWPKLSDLMQCWKRSQILYDFL